MKMGTVSESQIIKAIKSYESGQDLLTICREHSISRATFYNWRKKYGGMELNQVRRLKELEEENRRLKHMYAELSLDHKILKDVLEKKF